MNGSYIILILLQIPCSFSFSTEETVCYSQDLQCIIGALNFGNVKIREENGISDKTLN